jgi:hypothetical protein
MATVTITIEDRSDGCDVRAVCSGAGEEVTPAMVIAYNFLQLAGNSANEMPQVQQPLTGLRNEAVH